MFSRRRALLALAGSVTLAGCASTDDAGTSERAETSEDSPEATPTPEPGPDWLNGKEIDGDELYERDVEVVSSGHPPLRMQLRVERANGDAGLRDLNSVLFRTDITLEVGRSRDDGKPPMRFADEYRERSDKTRGYRFDFGNSILYDVRAEGDPEWGTARYTQHGRLEAGRHVSGWRNLVLSYHTFTYDGQESLDGTEYHRFVSGELGDADGLVALVGDSGQMRRLSGTTLVDGNNRTDPDPASDTTAVVEFDFDRVANVPEPEPPEWARMAPWLRIRGTDAAGVYELSHEGGATVPAGASFEITSHDADGETISWTRAPDADWTPDESRKLAFVERNGAVDPRLGSEVPDETVEPESPPIVLRETAEYKLAIDAR